MSIYADKEIIIYCRSGRRTGFAAQILIDNGFTGIVYNLVGGINSWKSSGLPTTLN
jgi:rhodanese-related sulfurtransferase